jgi:hypothetical protein
VIIIVPTLHHLSIKISIGHVLFMYFTHEQNLIQKKEDEKEDARKR